MGDAEFVDGGDVPMSVGERLRQAREAAGLTLEDIATSTRIPTRHLESLESGDFSRLPAPTYTIGFAKNYAGAVGLDRAEIGDQLRAEMGGTRPTSTTPEVFEPADPARAMPKGLIIGAIIGVVLVALLFNWLSNRSLQSPDQAAAVNEAAPPVTPAAPAAQQAQGPVVISASDRAWIEVKDGNVILKQGELGVGQSFEVPANAVAPTLTTAKPEALRISVGTADAPPFGVPGRRITISLKPEDLLRAPQTAAPAPPASRVAAEPAPQPASTPRARTTARRPAPPPTTDVAPPQSEPSAPATEVPPPPPPAQP